VSLFEVVYHIIEADEVHVVIEFAEPSTSQTLNLLRSL
jgi:hypothetical protein